MVRRPNNKFHTKDSPSEFTPKSDKQKQQYINSQSNPVSFALGPSGSGKTYTSLAYAASQYEGGKGGSKIFITRSLVGVDGEDLGALKGSLEDKLDPWFSTFYDILCEIMGKGKVDTGVRNGNIVFKPLMFLRGTTLDNCTVVCTEVQNLTWMQLKTLLTRQGEYSKFILEGDPNQCDLDSPEDSGLNVVMGLINDQGLPVPVVEYTAEDCIRSGVVKMWLEAFERAGK